MPTSNSLRRRLDPLLQLLRVLKLRELGRHQPQHDALMLGKMPERLERPRALGVVFKIVRVDVDLLEELDGDAVVSAFTEVFSSLRANLVCS